VSYCVVTWSKSRLHRERGGSDRLYGQTMCGLELPRKDVERIEIPAGETPAGRLCQRCDWPGSSDAR
jgi:hypothetical protein